jgi:alpha-ketoglutarate-dependent taurine dioxygenase
VPEDGRVRRLHPDFAVELVGLDLRGRRSARARGLVADALRDERVVVVRGQRLSPTAQLRLAASLGTLQGQARSRGGRRYVPDVRAEVSGGPAGDGGRREEIFYNQRWHADLSWAPLGSPVSLLYAVAADAGCASTSWADMIGAYRSLDEETRARVRAWEAFHHVARSRELRCGRQEPPPEAPGRSRRPAALARSLRGRWERRRSSAPHFRAVPSEVPGPPGARHAVVQSDPLGRPFVHAGDHAWALVGVPEPEGLALLDDLNRRIVAEPHVYRHHWQPGDLVVFDNRTLLHRRDPVGDPAARRVLRRCVVWRGAPPGG